jgi:hypothetical protein
MKIIASSEAIAVKLQKICIASSSPTMPPRRGGPKELEHCPMQKAVPRGQPSELL